MHPSCLIYQLFCFCLYGLLAWGKIELYGYSYKLKGYLKFEYRNLLLSLEDCPKLSVAYFKTVVRNFLFKEKQLQIAQGKLDSKTLTGKALKLACKIWDPMTISPRKVLKKFLGILAEMVFLSFLKI